MKDVQSLLSIPFYLENHLPHAWTYLLLFVRFTALMIILPGIGGGMYGLHFRMPAVAALAYVSMISGPIVEIPADGFVMLAKFTSEFAFGFILGLIPAIIIAGLQTAIQLSSGTMGLGAAQLMDPTMGVSVSSLGRLLGDLFICIFLVIGGHYVVLYAASGLGQVQPGTFLIEAHSIQILINQTGFIFDMAVMLSAPVIVALLLTQFVMGLISKAVPTVNIFIISFPLTIGIGLLLTIAALPEMMVYMEKHFFKIDKLVVSVSESADNQANP